MAGVRFPQAVGLALHHALLAMARQNPTKPYIPSASFQGWEWSRKQRAHLSKLYILGVRTGLMRQHRYGVMPNSRAP